MGGELNIEFGVFNPSGGQNENTNQDDAGRHVHGRFARDWSSQDSVDTPSPEPDVSRFELFGAHAA